MHEEWYRELLSLSPDPVFLAENRVISQLNPAALALGLDRGMALDPSIDPPRPEDPAAQSFNASLLGREMRVRCLCREGAVLYLLRPADVDGAVLSPAMIHTSNEIRHHLTDLNLSIEGLYASLDLDNARQARDASLALRSVYRLGRTAAHLDTCYRLATGDWILNRQELDVVNWFYDLMEEAGDLVRYLGIRLQTETDVKPFRACLDRSLARIIFWELLSNAAAHANGRDIHAELHRSGKDRILLTLTNHPDETELPNAVYDRFHAEPEDLSDRDGAGYGLYVARMAAGIHGGSVMLSVGADHRVRTTMSLQLAAAPDPECSAGRLAVRQPLEDGLVGLSAALPPEAYDLRDLLG